MLGIEHSSVAIGSIYMISCIKYNFTLPPKTFIPISVPWRSFKRSSKCSLSQ